MIAHLSSPLLSSPPLPVEFIWSPHVDDIVHAVPTLKTTTHNHIQHLTHTDFEEGAMSGVILDEGGDRLRDVTCLFHTRHIDSTGSIETC